MKNLFNRNVLFSLIVALAILMIADLASAQGLLRRNSGQQSGLKQQELDDAYYRGYNDAKSGKGPMNYTSGGVENNGQVVRGAARGALGGAAIGNLSNGDTGRGAAWGAGAGAIKGAVKKRRAAAEEDTWAAQLSGAYNEGYHKGMSESAAVAKKSGEMASSTEGAE